VKNILNENESSKYFQLLKLVGACRLDEIIFSKEERKKLKKYKTMKHADSMNNVTGDFTLSTIIISSIISSVIIQSGVSGS
jgi:hypothetical protein